MGEEGKNRRGRWETGTMQSLLIRLTGETVFVVCSSQLLHRKFWGTTGLCTAYSHMLLSLRPHLGPWTSVCNSRAFPFTRLKRREPSTSLCKTQNSLRTVRLFELWVRNKKGLGSPTVRTERGKYGLMIKNIGSDSAR